MGRTDKRDEARPSPTHPLVFFPAELWNVEREKLKQEIVDELKSDNKLAAFFKHPAVLLVIGSLMTGVVVAGLSNHWQKTEWDRQQSWQKTEWDRQQSRLARDRDREIQITLVEDLTRSVAETFTAAEDVVALVTWSWQEDSKAGDFDARVEQWNRASREWRTQEKILHARLAAHFDEPAASEKFETLVKRRRYVGNLVTNILFEVEKAPGSRAQQSAREATQAARDEALKIIGECTGQEGHLRELARLLLDEIAADDKAITAAPAARAVNPPLPGE